jgi:hypothetical protein
MLRYTLKYAQNHQKQIPLFGVCVSYHAAIIHALLMGIHTEFSLSFTGCSFV